MNSNISVSSFAFENAHSKKLLGFTIDRKSNFMIAHPIYVKREYKDKCHEESSLIYAFKSKETNNESHFNVPIWLLSTSINESEQCLK